MKKLFLTLALAVSALGAHAQFSNKYLAGEQAGKSFVCAIVPVGHGSTQEKIYFGSADIPAAERVFAKVVDLRDENRSTTGTTWIYALEGGVEIRVVLDDARNILSATCGSVTIRKSW